ncbi:ABC transporter ATP-binding protein [Verminephrobacter aporrectodeae]|uniref:ABC transporter ATP-binding protein n=1 Tax=Verminephrobacter aporrectodeae TaxID=1110389 RepID=UPI002238CDC3|nr:ABC transporter ATP-binding protein [Verminephrobacter aporrectodeae]MCW5220004.1 ABC transporter ATP-binding protein [Verminephrobacter aporrectodeae subsp. tuberculatae]MCW5289292.1 ABC transporter ATP-binding protein [Verminephrobacter aporrectodeae subsp. tuberculatae]MCW8176654.1 ABC transporter ATP-binding protein [Verminephrobacter aporrectodeae subsp. tuberculatae]MCW8204303.1 ABC transporter ATP-binding protein [Verminephrobacter aporrectodeae subsp. tuberculatae]MCW8206803.1 ABC t
MSAISIRSVRKEFKGHQALKAIDLEVRDQEFCVLLGPSGCGKTTLMRIIAGLETQTAGDVLINGKRMNGLPPRKRNIAMVFQNYAVFPHMTIAENIGFGLRMQKVGEEKVRTQVLRAAALMHIEHLLERFAGQISGGQRQRVAVARALAVEPDVLLMDEPLSNLDALLRLEMRSELKGLLRDIRTTTLYVTHDQTEAMSLADRIAVMHGGEIVQYDAPSTVYVRPATTFVGGFIGNPPMNFLSSVASHAALGVRAPHGATVLGIRPEDLDLVEQGGLEVSAKVVEMLGASQQVNARVNDELLRISTSALPAIAAQQRVRVRARPGAARWYDAEGRLAA